MKILLGIFRLFRNWRGSLIVARDVIILLNIMINFIFNILIIIKIIKENNIRLKIQKNIHCFFLKKKFLNHLKSVFIIFS